MKMKRTGLRRAGSVFLAIWLCIALIPLGVFADTDPDAGSPVTDDQEYTVDQDLQTDADLDAEEDGSGSQTAEEQTAEQPEEPDLEVPSDVESAPLGSTSKEPAYAAETSGDSHQHQLVGVAEVKATCQHIGVKAHRECTICGKWFEFSGSDPAEIDPDSIKSPITDHKWNSGTVISKATIDKNGKKRYKCTICGTTYDEEIVYNIKPVKAKSFKLAGKNLQFSQPVSKTVYSFMNTARISHIWIKAAKTQITVNWDYAKNMQRVDGVIILRKTGKTSTYKEIKRISFRTKKNGVSRWSPSKSFVDKTAKKKNTPYSYLVVSYWNRNGVTYIANPSERAEGQTSNSKLKNATTATINKKTAKLQSKGTLKLTLKVKKPKKKYKGKSFRWYSDNPAVAKVSSSGVVTAVGRGSTTIRGRLASGYDITCKVTVYGAFKPATPSLGVDTATNTSINLVWKKVNYATSYDLYRSDDGKNWKKPVRVNGTTKTVTGLTKGHKYYFYVVARNDRNGYTSLSNRSNVVNQKAIIKRRPTTVTDWPANKSPKAGTTLTVTIKVTSPDGRKLKLQMYENSKWVTKTTVTLPKGAGKNSVKLTFPKNWWGKTSTWRIVIPRSSTSEEYTSKTLTIKSARRYQNSSSHIQISDTISKHGYSHYVSPVLVNSNSTRSDHVEAFIKTANKYKGNSYVNGKSGSPSQGIDASGLVIQACYGAGVDLWPISPSTRPTNCVPKLFNAKLQKRTYTDDHRNINRGDLIFFYTTKNKDLGHVAIYLGYGKILHASYVTGKVEQSTIDELTKPVEDGGKYGYTVAGARRVFD